MPKSLFKFFLALPLALSFAEAAFGQTLTLPTLPPPITLPSGYPETRSILKEISAPGRTFLLTKRMEAKKGVGYEVVTRYADPRYPRMGFYYSAGGSWNWLYVEFPLGSGNLKEVAIYNDEEAREIRGLLKNISSRCPLEIKVARNLQATELRSHCNQYGEPIAR